MTTPDPRLLSDLARLLGTYKPRDWEALATRLQGDHVDELRVHLTEMALAFREVKESASREPARASNPRLVSRSFARRSSKSAKPTRRVRTC
jgi:hypothetical protein